MKIIFKKKYDHNQLICQRDDNTIEKIRLNIHLPYHDIAHYVIESTLNLKHGFFGNINNGYTIKELTQTEIVKKLHQESLLSEVLARGLQSLYAGSYTKENFISLIELELKQYNMKIPVEISSESINVIYKEYSNLISKWKNLMENDVLELEFKI